MSIRKSTPVLTSPRSRDWRHRRRGVARVFDEVGAMVLEDQKGRCAACHRRKGVYVDKVAENGFVLGVICGRCVVLLNLASRDPEIFGRVVNYLNERHQYLEKQGINPERSTYQAVKV